ncbi:unnamed protein product [Musa hybrid cultivar]
MELTRRKHWIHAPFAPSSSSLSQSSSSAPFRWSDGSSGSGDDDLVEKEHMFDKVVTPSDVGKLNRLVIPKQHAERYFPLDASATQRGLLLSFEDRNGNSWRFRYSYWNSSQSFVMTKGWSRFVKEKRLAAGDTVSFGRGVGESGRDRLYIDWKRRPERLDPIPVPRIPLPGVTFARSVGPTGGHLYLLPATTTVYGHHGQGYGYNIASMTALEGQFLYFPPPVTGRPPIEVQPGGGGGLSMVLDPVPVAHSHATARHVRLFGVNLVCPDAEDDGGVRGVTSSILLQSQQDSALRLLSLPLQQDTLVPSSSMIKEQHSPSDLDL